MFSVYGLCALFCDGGLASEHGVCQLIDESLFLRRSLVLFREIIILMQIQSATFLRCFRH